MQNKEIFESDDESDEEGGNNDVAFRNKRSKRNRASMYMNFMKNHEALIDKMIKENLERLALEALARRKISEYNRDPRDLIKGKFDYHFLLKMMKEPSYYELHRRLYIEGLSKAKEDFENRFDFEKRKSSEEQRVADEVAKILLDRHRAKVAKIIVERPYLQNQNDQQPSVK